MNDNTKELPEIVSTADDQIGLNLTIYNSDRTLVKDRRRVTLPPGECALAFREVSARIRPETALLSGGPAILEQNFEYDLLTPEALLHKYVGREVGIVRQHPTGGEDLPERRARVLSAAEGVVLEVGGRIETRVPGRIIYPDVPANLRDRPTLGTLVANEADGPQEVELSYLSGGLSWKADYVAELADDEQSLNLNGWVTLENESGASYRNARLQLVWAYSLPMEEETVLEYHLYTLGRPTTINDNQQKQVALLQVRNVRARKRLLLRGGGSWYNRLAPLEDTLSVDVQLEIENEKEQGLGLPIPAGVVCVYKKDSREQLQFVGEARVGHTPDKGTIRLHLCKAFDVTAARRQTDFEELAGDLENDQFISSHEITVKNAKDAPVQVQVIESVPSISEIRQESVPHTKENACDVSWLLDVPAKGRTVLTYTLWVKQEREREVSGDDVPF